MKLLRIILLCFPLVFGNMQLYIGGGNNPHDMLEHIVDSTVMWEGYDMAYEHNIWIYAIAIYRW